MMALNHRLPVPDLVRLAASGAGLELDASFLSVDDLAAIGAAALGSEHRPRIVMRRCSRLTADDLVRIAAAGPGCVEFVD